MTTPEKPQSAREIAFALSLVVPLAACGVLDEAGGDAGAGDRPAQENAAPVPDITLAPQNCLLAIWNDRPPADAQFDEENDRVEGGAISCATGATPGEFEAAIAAIREAARSGDKARLLQEIGVPLLYIDREGNKQELPDPETVDAIFDEIFDTETLAALSELDIADMAVSPGQGGSFQLGSLWLSIPEPGDRPRLVTVNRKALDQAAAAAREKAAGE